MTTRLFTFVLPGLLCLATMSLCAQSPCPDKIIATSTTASVNTEKPSMKNFDPSRSHPMIFDWTRRTFLLHSNAGSLQSRPSLPSPFFQPDNSSVSHLQVAPDMQSDDGWELIRQDFGYVYQPYGNDLLGLKRTDQFGNLQPVSNPYFILYNRYTGILRVFVAVGHLEQAYNAVQVRIYQTKMNTGDLQSSLLYESSDVKPVIALDEFPSSKPRLMAATPFINEGGLWFYADFPTTYDPCTCLYSSSLQIEVSLISHASVNLAGETEGTLISITNNQGQVDTDNGSTSFGLTNLIDGGKKAAESFKSTQDFTNKLIEDINKNKREEVDELFDLDWAGLTDEEWEEYYYNTLDPFELDMFSEVTEKYDSQEESASFLDNLLGSLGFLEKPLQATPGIAAAWSVVDFFIGGGKKEPERPQKVEVQPMAIRMATKLTGTITAEHPYKTINLFTPGAAQNATRLPETDYPMYNQTLGIFNLLKTPKVKAHYKAESAHIEYYFGGAGCVGKNTAVRYYQLEEDIKYVVNPAAGFDVNSIEVLASLVFEFDYDIEKELREYDRNMLVMEASNRCRTRYVPAGCMKDIFAQFLYRENSCISFPEFPYMVLDDAPVSRAPKVYVKLMVRLPRADRDSRTQGVLFVGKYPVSITDLPGYNPAEWTTHSDYDDVPNDIAFTNQVAGRYSAWNTITVESGADVGNYSAGGVSLAKADLVAGERITVKPGGRVHQESSLRIGLPEVCTRSLPPASASEIMSFCNSSAYQAARQFPKDMSEDVEPRPGTNTEPSVLLSISPNPSADRVAIRYHVAEPSPITIEIVNPLGVVVGVVASMSEHKPGEHTASFDGSSLARGVYYCVLRCNGDVQAQQFVLY